jgi:multiple antibiotic resistance protein
MTGEAAKGLWLAMHLAVSAFLLVFAGLFPIVNPLGNAPIFLAMTAGRSAAVRQSLAARIAVNGFLLLLASLFVGSYVLEFFGITVPVLRVAGGLVVAVFGWNVLRDGAESTHNSTPADREGPIDAFYPLTLPLTVGPGSMSVAIALGAQRPLGAKTTGEIIMALSGGLLGLAAIALTIFLSYGFAGRMVTVMGAGGINVLTRLSAFILLCIGIQIIWGGVSTLVGLPQT